MWTFANRGTSSSPSGKKGFANCTANPPAETRTLDRLLCFLEGAILPPGSGLCHGRPGWDNWLLWFARSSGAAVVDASSVVCAVHQNHDYGYHPDGEKGVWEGEEAQQNYQLLEGHR